MKYLKGISLALAILIMHPPILCFLFIKKKKFPEAVSTALNSIYFASYLVWLLFDKGPSSVFAVFCLYLIMGLFISISKRGGIMEQVSKASINRMTVMATFSVQLDDNEDGLIGIWRIFINHVKYVAEHS